MQIQDWIEIFLHWIQYFCHKSSVGISRWSTPDFNSPLRRWPTVFISNPFWALWPCLVHLPVTCKYSLQILQQGWSQALAGQKVCCEQVCFTEGERKNTAFVQYGPLPLPMGLIGQLQANGMAGVELMCLINCFRNRMVFLVVTKYLHRLLWK